MEQTFKWLDFLAKPREEYICEDLKKKFRKSSQWKYCAYGELMDFPDVDEFSEDISPEISAIGLDFCRGIGYMYISSKGDERYDFETGRNLAISKYNEMKSILQSKGLIL